MEWLLQHHVDTGEWPIALAHLLSPLLVDSQVAPLQEQVDDNGDC